MKTIVVMVLAMAIAVTAVEAADLLPPCPSSPNCVSSQAVDSHRISPFIVHGNPDSALQSLRELLALRPDTHVISIEKDSIKVEFRTRLGFVDDGLFVLDREVPIIHVYSAARLGYWDMGKNRSRLEEIRQQYVRAVTPSNPVVENN
jgi:uncharacterized protein (DUF1499 family)